MPQHGRAPSGRPGSPGANGSSGCGGQIVLGEHPGIQHGVQPSAQRLEHHLAHPSPVQAGRPGGNHRQAGRGGQLTQAGVGLRQCQKGGLQDLLHRLRARQRYQDRGVGPGQEGFIQRGGEVAGRHEEQVRVMPRVVVQGRQDRVRCPMHIGGIRAQRGLRAGHGHRLDLVEDHDRRLGAGQRGHVLRQQLVDLLLGLTVLGAHQPVRVDLDPAHLPARHELGKLSWQATGQGRLPGPRRAVQSAEAMQRGDRERYLGTQPHRQQALVPDPFLDLRRYYDGLPQGQLVSCPADDLVGHHALLHLHLVVLLGLTHTSDLNSIFLHHEA